MKLALFTGALCLLVAAPAQGAATWLAPVSLSKPGKDAFNPEVASDDAGDTVMVWERQHSASFANDIQFATRSPGGAFSAPADLSLSSQDPVVAMAPNGETAIAWRHFANPPGNYVIQVVTRSPGGAFSAPQDVTSLPVGVLPIEIRLDVNDAGDSAVTWAQMDPTSGLNPNPEVVMASTRPAGGSFSVPVRVSPPRPERADPEPGETVEEKHAREEREDEEAAQMTAAEPNVAIDSAGDAIVLWAYFDGTNELVQTARHPAAGGFSSPPTLLSDAGRNSGEAEIAVDDAGNAVAAWAQVEGDAQTIHAAVRPAAGSFSAGELISSPTAFAGGTGVMMTPSGQTTVAWLRSHEDEGTLEAVTRPTAGSFSAPEAVLGVPGEHPQFPRFAMSSDGDVAIVWSATTSPDKIVRASVRPFGGTFSPPIGLSETGSGIYRPTVTIDEEGRATAVWTRPEAGDEIVEAAGQDGGTPGMRDLSIPDSGTVGTPVSFSVTPFDDWPIGPATFSFGDGIAAEGNAVSHAYSAPGFYTVAVRAKDAVGNPVSVERTLSIAPRTGFSIGKLRLNKRKGTATLPVTVNEIGRLVLSGRGVRSVVKTQVSGAVSLSVKAKGGALRRLRMSGRLRTELKIAFTPRSAATEVLQIAATLGETHR